MQTHLGGIIKSFPRGGDESKVGTSSPSSLKLFMFSFNLTRLVQVEQRSTKKINIVLSELIKVLCVRRVLQVHDHLGREVGAVRLADAQILPLFETVENGLKGAK